MIVAKIIARVDRRRPIEVTDLVRPEAAVRRFRPFLWLAGGEGRNNQIDGDNSPILEGLGGAGQHGAVFRSPWLRCSGLVGWTYGGIVQAPQAASTVSEL